MTEIEKAKELLKNGTVLAVINGENQYVSVLRGVKALVSLLINNSELMDGAYIADKVVGKAAAILMVLGKVKEVYAITISKNAVKVFEKYGIKYSYQIITDFIINREGTGVCPMEQAVQAIEELTPAFEAIKNKLKEIS
jgi:predicted transcriptional regulator